MIETSDINDNWILERTRQKQTGDMLQWSIDLPSGRELTAAPFRTEERGKAIMVWLDTVRQEAAADARAEAEEKAAKARRNKVDPALSQALFGGNDDAATTSRMVDPSNDSIIPPSSYEPAIEYIEPDPEKYAQEMLERTTKEVEEATMALNNAQKWLDHASLRKLRWEQIMIGLEHSNK